MPSLLNGMKYVQLLLNDIDRDIKQSHFTIEQKRTLKEVRYAIQEMYDHKIQRQYVFDQKVDIQWCGKEMNDLQKAVKFDEALEQKMMRWWSDLQSKLQALNDAIDSQDYSIFRNEQLFVREEINPYYVVLPL